MKIVHLLISGDLAGGQVVALRLARAARDRGDDALFVVPADGQFRERAESEGFRVLVADVGRLHRMRGLVRLAVVLRAERADVLHTHTLAAANVLSRVAGRLAGVSVVSHLHIENNFRSSTRWLLASLDNVTAKMCAHLIAVSNDTRLAYKKQGYRPRIEIVYNGVDVDGAPAGRLRKELGLPVDTPLVGEIGRLCDVKGQRELIEALAQLPQARAVFVGADLEEDGAYEQELERAATRLGVRDRVIFVGSRADAAELLADFDVLALPSRSEGLPLVVLEAMARKRPVVATPVGGTPEAVVDGQTGLLVPPGDPNALARALDRLLRDPELRDRMGEAGYRRVQDRFSAGTMAARVLAVYDEVVA